MIRMRSLTLLAAGLALAAGAVAAQPKAVTGVSVRDGQVRAAPAGAPSSAAYMTIYNSGPKDDRLLSVACACAAQATVHASRMVHGVMHMDPATTVTVPAHGRLVFNPGGLHVMLTGLKGPLVDGQQLTLSLRFAHAGRIEAPFTVRSRILSEDMGTMHTPMVGMKP
jgi:copper(I)-binding protein